MNRTKGIILIIISAFGFAVMNAFVKLSGELPTFQKAFFRNLVAAIIALVFIVKNKESFLGKKSSQKLLLLRSICGTIGILFNYYSIDKLKYLSDVTMLNKLSPFATVIFAAIFLKERINKKQGISLIVAFIGALFIIRPSFDLDVMPAVTGALGGVLAGAAYTCLRPLGKMENHYTIIFYFSTFSCIVMLPFMISSYEPMTIIQLIYLVLAGVFASLGQFGITLAYKYAPAKEISIFDYTNVIFSALLSILIFGAVPDCTSITGYIIIFLASLYTFMETRKVKS
ncbi:MAG: DMT family transporter [Clostridiales bacterium]|nr:DMT family transporter [Clostridiales bacterium]